MDDIQTPGRAHLIEPSISVMALDMLAKILEVSGDVSELSRVVCREFRELTGARAVLVVQCMGLGQEEHTGELLACNPDRRRSLWEDEWLQAFLSHSLDQPPSSTVLYSSDCDTDHAPPEAFSLSMAMPLYSPNGRTGTVIAAGIPFRNRMHNLSSSLEPILSAIGTTLENAILTHRQQQILDQHAAKIRTVEAQLYQSQKLEAIGHLAGGVAHDFNNLLTGIVNCVELCREAIPEGHAAREWLDQIELDAGRSASLTRQLLGFARRQTISPRVLDLNQTVESALNMLRRLIGEDIDMLWRPGAKAGRTRMDPAQIDQILTNLCVNARHAIYGTGKVTIETCSETVDKAYCEAHSEAVPGNYAVLAVSDDGCGMDRSTLEHIFEPFFTTKQVGKGSGLGLATVYGIVRQNAGFVTVYSEPGQGTTFRIHLPSCGQGMADEVEAEEDQVSVGGDETILLVEDEKSIRITTKMLLQRQGYEVLTAGTPDEALRIGAENGQRISLLITDVVMPGMTGREMAERLTADLPALKVLYVSGYTANVIAHQGVLDEGVDFLSKPISPGKLAAKVRTVLDRDAV